MKPRVRTRTAETRSDEGRMTVLKSVSLSGEKKEDSRTDETIAVRKFETAPAYVRVSAGATKNLGDYESLRVDVSVEVPCYYEEIDSVIEDIAEFVSDKLESEVVGYIEE